MESFWIAIAAGVVSLATLVLSGISLRHKAGVDYVQSLEERLDHAEEALERCRTSEVQLKQLCGELERKNMVLMRMIIEHDEKEK